MLVDIRCIMCKTDFMLDVPQEGYRAWRSGEKIQKALPTLTPDQRELLLSGICGECFDKIFGGD